MKKIVCLFFVLSFFNPIFAVQAKKNSAQFRSSPKKSETLSHLKRRYSKDLIKKNLVNPEWV